jgi:succinate-semialdehyde dehydrogenase / glutarate-semialdehyde dehydrogenase
MEHYINGAWTPSNTASRIAVLNKATGAVIDSVPAGDAADAERAIQAAHAAQAGWAAMPLAKRAALQHAAATGMRGALDEFAHMLAREVGRPLAGCRTEIERSADLLDFYAEEGLRVRGEMPMLNEPDVRVMIIQQPVGVSVLIAPFNFPVTLLMLKLGAALIAGCAVVVKPSEDTPLSALRLAEIFAQAGYPPGVFNVVTGYGATLGGPLCTHPLVRKVAFTGSVPTGQRIAALATGLGKRITLELGGQCPAVVYADADLDTAIPAMVRHAYANSGQYCYRINRIYVHEAIYAQFAGRFAAQAAALVVGDPFDPRSALGPLIGEKTLRTAEAHVADAVAHGATVACGGARLSGGPYDGGAFFPPTLLTGCAQHMKIMREETFAPVVGVMPVSSNEQALTLANDSEFGLAAFVFTRDLSAAIRAAERLETGSVWINNIQRSYHMTPFGGMKQSGLGREKGRYAIESYLEHKTMYVELS